MNAKQREFLINKVKENKNKLIKEIEATMPKAPDMSHYILLAVMSDNFELKSMEEIRKALRAKAAEVAIKGKSFVDSSWDYDNGEKKNRFRVYMTVEELFHLPEDYMEEYRKYDEAKKISDVQKKHIENKSDTLVTRITLASPSMLTTIIEEVDSMGSLSIKDMVVQKLGPAAARLALKALDEEDKKLLN